MEVVRLRSASVLDTALGIGRLNEDADRERLLYMNISPRNDRYESLFMTSYQLSASSKPDFQG